MINTRNNIITKFSLLCIVFFLISCQSLNTSFGKFNFNNNQEIMLNTVGYENGNIFKPKFFNTYNNAINEVEFQVTLKSDSISLSPKKELKYFKTKAKNNFLNRTKKQVFIVSIINEQELIGHVDSSINLNSNPKLKIITDIVIKSESVAENILLSDSYFFQYNTRNKTFELKTFKSGNQKVFTLNPQDIIGYNSKYICGSFEQGKFKAKLLSTSYCPRKTFKTNTKTSKMENYERL